ncbi:hypothetical protein [Bacillus sonorensis]|uniref:hypothetical protein n=1 Tax=Bacillus sonorensis TaxID=119858 RepID=UPI001F3FDD10|nr:hypothetical protein [Bacillus sonorensis]MCF7618579.1 hypothetical protein [Bacillus sonorensis]MCY7858800.1 hypothetical protein [Bacillus sonorensis]MCY8034126.1 hypothetical protein [Bacillus sonorensis]
MKTNMLTKTVLSSLTLALFASSLTPMAKAEEAEKPLADELSKNKSTYVQHNDSILFGNQTLTEDQELDALFSNVNLIMFKTQELAKQQEPVMKTQAGATKAVKETIKAVLKNKKRLFDIFESVAGKRHRNTMEKRFNKYIEPTLKNLLKYESLAWSRVEDAIATALHGTGIKSSTARSIAFWLRHVMEWLF